MNEVAVECLQVVVQLVSLASDISENLLAQRSFRKDRAIAFVAALEEVLQQLVKRRHGCCAQLLAPGHGGARIVPCFAQLLDQAHVSGPPVRTVVALPAWAAGIGE
jgi:hypothetical protein